MAKKTFISFRGDDKFKVWTLRGLAEFRNITFEMDDVSLREAIQSKDENYIRSVIRPKIKDSLFDWRKYLSKPQMGAVGDKSCFRSA